MNRDALARLVREHDLPQLLPLMRPSVRLRRDPTLPPVGRLGGSPPLPPGTDWPWANGAPQLCLATLDGAALAALLPDTGIAPTGFTSFFYDATLESGIIDPSLREWARVVAEHDEHRAEAPALPPDERSWWERRRRPRFEFGDEPWGPLRWLAVGGEVEWTLPEETAPEVEALELDDGARERHFDLVDAVLLSGPDTPLHRVGGWPDPVQHDPRPAEPGWRQLLQVESDDDLGIMWGDAGILHVIARGGEEGALHVEWQCA